MEYREPSTLYTGPDPAQAPALIEVRRWASPDWSLYDRYPDWHDAGSGARIGCLYWDEAQGVLWYQIHGYYKSGQGPTLGATKLLDAVDPVRGGNYRQVGSKHGPWWYRSANLNGPAYDPHSRQISSIAGQAAVWDPVAQDILWLQPTTAGARPTLHVFKVQ